MIAIVDYGMGNTASVSTAFTNLGYEVVITDDIQLLESATHVILPGVGSFKAAMEEINDRNLNAALRKLAKEKPFLGICLGMQLLFEKGFENGETVGLEIIPGTIDKIETPHILPHIGWNKLQISDKHPAFNRFEAKHVYFVHSYQANTAEENIVATTDYGTKIPGIVRKGNVFGIQFHPEKSGEIGIEIIRTFMNETANR
ncbi:imidazole glycerol phosphate synthase subunit HisH [Saliterribacillus persicus]|uniref:Imidazole glycerol phosphate synthase subunit HisH n=1 Tax=Saliterribacillus persicus TaxID=930114 RepID=A0A368X9U1_9BACI|nr:imidazole glycerol phosphate synthase subunit HisH [Saliterribacillus persicus]RCW63768.1 imidazole glycerol phosphate synthase subunit HisH [Saliterribacillus persicus]